MSASRALIGIGNIDRGDDAAGLCVADTLLAAAPAGLDILKCGGDISFLLEAFQRYDDVTLVDAMQTAAEAPRVQTWQAHQTPLPTTLSSASSHVLGLAQAVELARALDQLPRRLLVVGVKGHRFELSRGLSEEAQAAVSEATELLKKEYCNA